MYFISWAFNIILKRSVVLLRIEALYLKTQSFEVSEPHLKLCVWILPAILFGQQHLPKCFLWVGNMLGVCTHEFLSVAPQFGWLFSSKMFNWLSLSGCLPSGPVLFPPSFLNSAGRVQLLQKCQPLRLSLVITSLILLKVTHSIVYRVLSEWTRRWFYI